MPGPLQGIRILDLSRVLAGPLATQTLADLGAEVIKIERPGVGDDTRTWGPPFLKDRSGANTADSTYFACCNRGKKSVTIDLARPEGADLVRRLAATADVLVENFKVGDLARRGLDYASLQSAYPRLIYCSITGYGQTGPYRERAGYDPILQAMGGLMSVTGEPPEKPGGGPQRVGVAVIDVATALYAVSGIQAALLERMASGRGQHLDLALLEVQIASLINIAQAYLSAGVVAVRNGNVHPSVVPSQVFDCANGSVMLVAGNNGQFQKLCQVLGVAGLAEDRRFATNEARVQHRAVLTDLLENELRRKTAEHWTTAFSAVGVPCGPINNVAQVFEDPQVKERQVRQTVEHPTLGSLPTVANPLRFSRTAVDYVLPPPLLGAHTDEVLRGVLKLPDAEIERLRRASVI